MISNYLDLIVSFNLSTKYLKYKLVRADGMAVNFGRIRYKGGKTTWSSFDGAVYLGYDVYNSSLFFIRKGLIKNINVLYSNDNPDNNNPTFIYYITRVDMENDYHLLLDYK